MATLVDLPSELLVLIFEMLPLPDTCALQRVCSVMHTVGRTIPARFDAGCGYWVIHSKREETRTVSPGFFSIVKVIGRDGKRVYYRSNTNLVMRQARFDTQQRVDSKTVRPVEFFTYAFFYPGSSKKTIRRVWRDECTQCKIDACLQF